LRAHATVERRWPFIEASTLWRRGHDGRRLQWGRGMGGGAIAMCAGGRQWQKAVRAPASADAARGADHEPTSRNTHEL
jgi:hypothetical protein